jgi:hypothetical protein
MGVDEDGGGRDGLTELVAWFFIVVERHFGW